METTKLGYISYIEHYGYRLWLVAPCFSTLLPEDWTGRSKGHCKEGTILGIHFITLNPEP